MGTFFDDASLVMIPSGVKESKLYSIKPTDGTGDFTFTRGTDTATRVNSAGLIEKETQNLLLQSNTFDTTWVANNASVTSGQSGYDGTSDAWLLSKSAASGRILQSISNSNVSTYSIYAKAGTLDWILLFVLDNNVNPRAYFDLSNGVIGTNNDIIDSNIQSVGGGWYRCSITYKKSIAEVRIFPANADNDISGTSGSIYIQDAQLEQSLVARAYIETTTAAVYAGITDNLPRLDYSGGASCPSLLLEPQRTNLFTQSEYFSGWSTIQNATITDNDLSSPEGLQNAAKITDNATSGNHRIFQSVTTTAASHTFSIFLKKGTMTTAFLFFNSGGTAAGANVDLDAGTITATAGSAAIEDYGSDWYRCSITGTAVAGTSYLYVYMKQLSGYSGSGQDMYLYGAQLEAGSYPTSYIPTMGVSATRAKDTINQNIQALTSGLTEGTLFVEFEKPNTGENNDLMRWKGSGTLGRAFIYNTAAGFASNWGSNSQLNIGGGDNNKAAWRLDSLSSGVEFVNGVKGSGGSGTAWSDIRELRFNADGNGGVLKIKQILFFPTALTDAECITLTTL